MNHSIQIFSPLKIPFKLISSFKEVYFSNAYRNLVWVPYIAGAFGFVISLIIFWNFWIELQDFLPTLSRTWVPDFLRYVFESLVGLLSDLIVLFITCLLASLVAILASLVLGAIFLEQLIIRRFSQHKIEFNEPKLTLTNWVKACGLSIKDELWKFALFTGLGVCLLISSFFPPLAALVFIIGAALVGFELLDEPLSIAQVSFSKRLRFILKHPYQMFVFGALFSLISLVPFGSIIFLPAAYLLAVDLLNSWGCKELLRSSAKISNSNNDQNLKDYTP